MQSSSIKIASDNTYKPKQKQQHKYYADAIGYIIGIFDTWGENEINIDWCSGTKFKKFNNYGEAVTYLCQNQIINTDVPLHAVSDDSEDNTDKNN